MMKRTAASVAALLAATTMWVGVTALTAPTEAIAGTPHSADSDGDIASWQCDNGIAPHGYGITGTELEHLCPAVTAEVNANPRKRAAQAILARIDSGQHIFEDWTWAGAPAEVNAWNDSLVCQFAGNVNADLDLDEYGYEISDGVYDEGELEDVCPGEQ